MALRLSPGDLWQRQGGLWGRGLAGALSSLCCTGQARTGQVPAHPRPSLRLQCLPRVWSGPSKCVSTITLHKAQISEGKKCLT